MDREDELPVREVEEELLVEVFGELVEMVVEDVRESIRPPLDMRGWGCDWDCGGRGKHISKDSREVTGAWTSSWDIRSACLQRRADDPRGGERIWFRHHAENLCCCQTPDRA